MSCPQCGGKQITLVDSQQICNQCGTVVSENFIDEDEYVVQGYDEETGSIINLSRKETQSGETRREKAFLSRINQYASILGLTYFVQETRQLYFAHRNAIQAYRSRYSPEATVSLLYLATRAHRSGTTLSDYASKLGLADVRSLNTAFKRLDNIIKEAAFSSTVSPSPSPIPTTSTSTTGEAATPSDYVVSQKARISGVVAKLFEPISKIFHLEPDDLLDLEYWSQRVCIIAEHGGLGIGRQGNPIIAACVVIGARAIGNGHSNHRGDIEIDWTELAQHISYGYTTIRRRYAELIKILKQYAKRIPWLANVKMTKNNLEWYLREIVQMGANSSSDTQQLASIEFHPPTYARNQALVQQRSAQIAIASKFLVILPSSSSSTSSVTMNTMTMISNEKKMLSLDPEIRMIYLLLVKNMPSAEIEEMQNHHLYEHVYRLYMRGTSVLSPEEMNSTELTEKDMGDEELAQYVK
ncbi:hypothetical protein BDA99DRAFT_541241 [Phascolomyces articulosus]|uniref:TFIIB-type domain-containing protein n=1 Tax=Phascolomyces articulosus TaxID=60185 RepID=A0AAD5K5M5_9FUNG|nr:hypothetical protein BDA99DRAFT_541241 [Phascolomyces articulosus]